MFSKTSSVYLCSTILSSICVGHYHSLSAEDLTKTYRTFVDTQLAKYENGNYSFQEGTYFRIYRPGQNLKDIDINGNSSTCFIHKLKNHVNCLGLKTQAHETIILECSEKEPKKSGCFDVYSPGYVPGSDIFFIPDQKVENICVRILNERCIGIITPSNWTLPLECTRIADDSVVPKSAINVPYNGPPPRI